MAEMDIEIDLRDVDHEADDKKAMEAYQQELEAQKAVDADVAPGESQANSSSEEKNESQEVQTSK